MHKKHIFLRVFSKITIFACVCCAFFISPVFATLHAGYTELEYIESTGTQWIDTGILSSNYNTIRVKLKSKNTSSSTSKQILISTCKDYNGTWFGYLNKKLTSNETSASDFDSTILQNIEWSTYNIKSGIPYSTIAVNGSNWTYTRSARQTTTYENVILFRSNSTGSSFASSSQMYKVEIYGDDNLIANLAPAKRNSDGEVGMYDTVSQTFFTNQGTGEFIAGPIAHCKTFGTDGVTCTECESGYKLDSNGVCVGVIEIATTKMVDEEFAAAELKLAETVETIEDVVSRTITQTGQIATLQSEKQTRPNETCPAGKKCLLVMDENDIPHWYEIIEAVYDFVANWFTPFNDAGRPTFHYTTDTSSGSTIWTSYNGFYKGDSAFRKNYIDGSTSTYDRPFAHATRCNADYTRTTDSRGAGICYPETGVFKTLANGEWAVVYNGSEGSSTKKVPASVVYGTSKCTTVAGPNNYAKSNPTKFSELTPAQQTAWGVEPNPTNKSANAGYLNCWCKMTALGIPNSGETIASGQSTAGVIYPLPESSSAWVFGLKDGSAADCANHCAIYCAYYVRFYAGFRAAVLSWQ